MRKLLLNFVLIVSVPFIAQAGYVIRGISVNNPDVNNLMNYTLTIDGNDSPIAAGTMHAIVYGSGRNSIVIIDASNSIATYFPIPYYDIEVRDFHRVIGNEYVLCGSCNTGQTVNAFVAVIDGTFSTMDFYEYPEADMFYSICENFSTAINGLGYYVCGTKGDNGVIAAINRWSMQFTNFYTTTAPWEYHKIIAKRNADNTLRFVASGRNPDCTRIGFTAFAPPFNIIGNYAWGQQTEPDSHCVVGDYIGENNKVVLASSFINVITLNPITFPLPAAMQISAYRFITSASATQRWCVQDIGTILDFNGFRISVAGYVKAGLQPHIAWHGYTIGLSAASTLTNNFYDRTITGRHEHYKIRYDQTGKEYTGGYFQDGMSTCALFASPLIVSDCDSHRIDPFLTIENLNWLPFSLVPVGTGSLSSSSLPSSSEYMDVDDECPDFKSAPAPEYAMPSPEDESDIIALQDRITLKDVPSNTNYQIYSIIGQLMQTGTTTSDISTAQLGKGVYILRLENGKTFKFVK